MADAAVQFLLVNLKQLLLYNANLIIDVKDHVENLYNDLSAFQAFLKESTEMRHKSELMKDLVKQIRNVVYEAEDVIDTFVAQAVVHKNRNYLEKTFRVFDYPLKLRNLVEQIMGIRAKTKDIQGTKRFELEFRQRGDGSDHMVAKEKKAPVVEEDNVVGFDDEAENVINLLMGGSNDLEVISIVGMPGLGKTTLAKMIFRNPKIEYEFYNRAWVYVSQDYSRKEVFLSILSNFIQLSGDIRMMDAEQLVRELRKHLEQGRYFIVMDDVWSEQAWNDIKIAFPKNKKGSRILITSRIRKVAMHANPGIEPYDLRFLTDKESWTLLQRKALGSENCPSELTEFGISIVKECKGLPLAIVVIGGILLEKGTLWWEHVAKSVDAHMAMDEEKRMEKFIALSYNHLPYHLKACFIYFGMFPEDYDIPVWKLIRLWIAEGFIQQNNQEMSLEDLAEEYLDDLVSRNLVMTGSWKSNGRLKTCRIHDMLHEFCKKEAAEDNFFHEVKGFDHGMGLSINPAVEKHRRLCIHSRTLEYISSKPTGPRVRSFLCFSSEEIALPAEHISAFPGNFKLLRILDARPISFGRFPTDLSQLIHLRYITISSNFTIIPAALSSLWNIQTLLIETSSRKLEIKADIWKMIQLRHVKINASTILPNPLSKSRKSKEVTMIGILQTLSMVSPESCSADIFARVPNLKNLGIRGQLEKLLEENKDGTMLFDSLGKLSHVDTLKLCNDVFPRPASVGKLVGLPQKYKFPPKLKKLTLSNTLLDWKDLSILGTLENLEILKLKDHAFLGKLWEVEDEGFHSLRVFHIGRTDLDTWRASAHHFPRLRQLFIKHCTDLKSIPTSFIDIASLQLIDLFCSSSSAATSAREIKKIKTSQNGKNSRSRGFKLSIYPPDELSETAT